MCKPFSRIICAAPRLFLEREECCSGWHYRSISCLWERVVVGLYLCGLMLYKHTMGRRRSCSGIKFCQKACESVWCLGQSLQILWGGNNKQGPSWDHHPGVKDQQILPCWCSGPGREVSWGCLKDQGTWSPGGLSSLCRTGRWDQSGWYHIIVVVIFKCEVRVSTRQLMAAGTLLGWLMLPRIYSNFCMHPCTGGEERMLQSCVIPVQPSFRPCTYFIPSFVSTLAGCGFGGIGLIEQCWTAEVAEGMWMTLCRACLTDPTARAQGLHLPTLGPCDKLACHSVVVLQAQGVDMNTLAFARCSCEMWPWEHSTACFVPCVRARWLSLSPWGQAAL